jgi:hypothetical protein
MKRRKSSLPWVMALLASLTMPLAHGSMMAQVPLDIREQIAAVDHAVYAEIVEVQPLGEKSARLPIGRCGMLYRIRVLEQFKGSVHQTEWFVTQRILFPERPLSVGDQVLVLLRDLARARPQEDALVREEFEQLREELRACGPEKTTLYLGQGREGIFPIVTEKTSAGSTRWMQFSYSGNTIMPAEVLPPPLTKCVPQPRGGCIIPKPERVEWAKLRKALRSWMGESK